MNENILEIRDLYCSFYVKVGVSRILNGVNLHQKRGTMLGLVGESGSGKSVLAMAVLGYVKKPGKIEKGAVIFAGESLLEKSEEELIDLYRGKRIGLISSNARAHLNPLLSVGRQISNVYIVHSLGGRYTKESKDLAYQKTIDMLKLVGINDPERRYDAYPHELSGGMAQRVMIAMTLINEPELIIADDSTNGLDVTIAAQVMDLIMEILDRRASSSLLITHDLGIVAQCCDEIAIMYAGQIVERSTVDDFFSEPKHPYSSMMLNAMPENRKNGNRLEFTGTLPNPLDLPVGCIFHTRCPRVMEVCHKKMPEMSHIDEDRMVMCHLYQNAKQ
ncbi:MAG: ABC transporter ATP-binding protein [Spirochaetia bacterium]|jgi:oligopeptide/dipeptide ABC transporter ATP-binding protein